MTDSTSFRVLSAVAQAEGVSPTALPPLTDAVDPDALDTLYGHEANRDRTDRDVSLQFSYAGYDVTLCGDAIVLRGRTSADGHTYG